MSVTIFFCYAHEDEALLKKLKAHLTPLQRQNVIDLWHDRDISAGSEWQQQINHHLNAAQIILLLISPDFMASDYCYGIEMKRALERHQRGEARVIPIILRHVYWQGILGTLQALPTDAKPVRSWSDEDEALFDVTEGIRKVVVQLGKKSLLSSEVLPSQASKRESTDVSPTAIPAITAMQLYRIFRHHGLAKNDSVENNSEYQSEGINPEGGAVDFTDYSSGQPYTISVFATSTEASQAATILYNGGDNAYIPNGCCMLHVSLAAHASDFALKGYTSIMDTMCKPS